MQQAILKAEMQVRQLVKETPLELSHFLSTGEHQVYLKLEQLQHTGSFKLRGASNKLLSLSQAERDMGVVTASTGNHGAAVAYAAHHLGVKALVFVPEGASPTKLEAIRQWGAALRLHGDDGVVAERFARAYALEHQLPFISPYNDLDVMAGQGTLGVELYKQLPEIDTLLLSLGGGGLLSGVACALKTARPDIKIIACSPQNSAVMMDSLEAGEILDLPSLATLSDGTAGGVEEDAITFAYCQQLIDERVKVSEEEIAEALKTFISSHQLLIEGAAATVLAAYKKHRANIAGKKVVLLLCGANISLETLEQVLRS
ncbi:MAG: threonine/serine dehydratase [Trueperaceae bacterium]|nr:threonine/serine dehydratase [Trueperaceae bacterium]